MATRRHVEVGLAFTKSIIKERGNLGYVEINGTALSKADALAFVQGLIDKGRRVTSNCPTQLPDGGCPGHPASS